MSSFIFDPRFIFFKNLKQLKITVKTESTVLYIYFTSDVWQFKKFFNNIFYVNFGRDKNDNFYVNL